MPIPSLHAFWKPAFWLCAVAVLVLSLAPATEELPTTGWDKSNHFLGFCVLAILGLLAYPARLFHVVIGLLVYGGAIELLQSLTPHRLGDWADWLADAIGVAIGMAIHFGLARWHSLLSPK
jgi:VanZ family protein